MIDEDRAPWRIRKSYVSTPALPLWTVFRLSPGYHGAGHNHYRAVKSTRTHAEAIDWIEAS